MNVIEKCTICLDFLTYWYGSMSKAAVFSLELFQIQSFGIFPLYLILFQCIQWIFICIQQIFWLFKILRTYFLSNTSPTSGWAVLSIKLVDWMCRVYSPIALFNLAFLRNLLMYKLGLLWMIPTGTPPVGLGT